MSAVINKCRERVCISQAGRELHEYFLWRAFLWWWSPLWWSLLWAQGGGLVAVWGSAIFHQEGERHCYWSGDFFMRRLSNEMEHLCICSASLEMWHRVCSLMAVVNYAFGSVCLSSRCIPRWHFCNPIKRYRMLHLKWKLDCCFQTRWGACTPYQDLHLSAGRAPGYWCKVRGLREPEWLWWDGC